jgi:hypothetical protein
VYVTLAWLIYLAAAVLAIRTWDSKADMFTTVATAVIGGAIVYVLAGGIGHTLAQQGQNTSPSSRRQASAVIAVTLILVTVAYVLAGPNH